MISIGTPKSAHATRVLLLGSGELGKEVVIELQRFGVEVIACDRYADAPAMQVAHRSHVIDMLDRAALRAVVELEKPHLIVPEIEAIGEPGCVLDHDLRAGGRGIEDRAFTVGTAVDHNPGRRRPRCLLGTFHALRFTR